MRDARGTPNDSPILGRALCLTPKGSPIPGRVSHLNEKFQDSLTLTSDTDSLVAKISAMFPTVSETHIKILLKKYYNREAVVISALQVEKHPITTPGPLTMSPSTTRLQKGAMGVYSALQLAKGLSGSMHGSMHLTPLSGTPHGSPSLLRPASGASSYYGTARSVDGQTLRTHHSPKMKLKYLKSIFPKAEETLILDVLANKDNNVQKASEELMSMGFPKKDTLISNKPSKKVKEKETPQPPKKVVTLMKTTEEKEALKKKLAKKYSSMAERVITLALESVDFNEERAEQMLLSVLQENAPRRTSSSTDQRPAAKSIEADHRSGGVVQVEVELCQPPVVPSMERSSRPRRVKFWTDKIKPIFKSSPPVDSGYKSQYLIGSSGPNPQFRSGPKDNLLLEEYVPWNGPNRELRMGQSVTVEGPDSREKLSGYSLAKGPNPNLKKGPSGLAKGSIYQKLTKKSAKMFVH